jgi:hypothetical protein
MSDLPTNIIYPSLDVRPYIQLVRELAESGPLLSDDAWCASCDFDPYAPGVPDTPEADINDPANHAPTCLWRRAVALRAAAGAT